MASKNASVAAKCLGTGCIDPTHISSSHYTTLRELATTAAAVSSLPYILQAGERRLVPCGTPRSKLEREVATASRGGRNGARQTSDSVSAVENSPGPFMPLAVGTDTTCNIRL